MISFIIHLLPFKLEFSPISLLLIWFGRKTSWLGSYYNRCYLGPQSPGHSISNWAWLIFRLPMEGSSSIESPSSHTNKENWNRLYFGLCRTQKKKICPCWHSHMNTTRLDLAHVFNLLIGLYHIGVELTLETGCVPFRGPTMCFPSLSLQYLYFMVC